MCGRIIVISLVILLVVLYLRKSKEGYYPDGKYDITRMLPEESLYPVARKDLLYKYDGYMPRDNIRYYTPEAGGNNLLIALSGSL